MAYQRKNKTVRVRLLKEVRPDFPLSLVYPNLVATPGSYVGVVNQYGAVSIVLPRDEGLLGVKPGEFEFE